jgi:cytochrome c biogenesis protein CcmG, thiol:disulfide interchange protein DsbE
MDGSTPESAPTGRAAALARSRRAGWAALALFALLLAINAASIARGWQALRPMSPGDPAPEFALPRIGAGGEVGPEQVSLSSFRGRVVVIDFWATWCGPCLESMPVIERVVLGYRERGVGLLSVNTEGVEVAGKARRMADSLSPSAELVSDEGRVGDLYQVSTIPHLVVVDREGRVRLVHRGFSGARSLERQLTGAIDELLAE